MRLHRTVLLLTPLPEIVGLAQQVRAKVPETVLHLYETKHLLVDPLRRVLLSFLPLACLARRAWGSDDFDLGVVITHCDDTRSRTRSGPPAFFARGFFTKEERQDTTRTYNYDVPNSQLRWPLRHGTQATSTFPTHFFFVP